MAKNSKTEKTPATANTSASLSRLADIRAKQEEVRKQLAALAQEAENEATAIKQDLADKFGALPAQLGFANWGEFYSAAKEFNRGLATGGTGRSKFSDEEKAQAIELYKTGRKADATPAEKLAGVRSAICETIGCSAPTLQNWLDEAGLVTKRNVPASA